MIYEVQIEPHPILRKRSEEIPISEIATPAFQTLIDNMIETMYAANGIGLAGPQIGESRRVIIVEQGEHNPLALVNPIITSKSWRKVQSEEGCLSVPGVYGVVKRHKKITAQALDRKGNKITITDANLLSIIIQHEIDHLDGILFIDKATNIRKIDGNGPKI